MIQELENIVGEKGRRADESEASAKIKKQGCQWILVSHDQVKPSEFLNKWEEVRNGDSSEENKDLSFKMEPAILHVQCRKLSDAKRLVPTIILIRVV